MIVIVMFIVIVIVIDIDIFIVIIIVIVAIVCTVIVIVNQDCPIHDLHANGCLHLGSTWRPGCRHVCGFPL